MTGQERGVLTVARMIADVLDESADEAQGLGDADVSASLHADARFVRTVARQLVRADRVIAAQRREIEILTARLRAGPCGAN